MSKLEKGSPEWKAKKAEARAAIDAGVFSETFGKKAEKK